MSTNSLSVPFQPCRRRGEGRRRFLPLKLQTVEYLIRFTDGSRERYRVSYTASIEAEKPRRRWRYRGHVSRQLSIYNRAGEQFDKVGVDRRVELPPNVGRNESAGWSDWRECVFKHEPSLLEDEFEEMFLWLIKAFTASIIADKRRMENHFRQSYKGVEAISEID